MKKVIGIKRIHNETDGSIETDIDLAELSPIVQLLNELGVDITLGMMTKIIEDIVQGVCLKETKTDYPAYTLISNPKNMMGIEIVTTKEGI